MGHTISDRRRQERFRELAPEEWREQQDRPRKEALHAKRIVELWNKRAKAGRPVSFFPTIGTVIAAKMPVLDVLCPA